MRTINASILAQLQAEELKPFYLLSWTIDGTTYRYTDCDVPIYLTNNYSPLGFKFANIRYSINNIVDKVDVEVDNLDQVQTAIFVGGTPQGSDVVLSLVVLDADLKIVNGSAVTLFEGEIDTWNLNERRLSVTVTSIFYNWGQRTLSKHSPSCRWKAFKSTECGYVGAADWCDRTYTKCVTLSNTTNYGGFRWLPSIVDREIWWGRVQGQA